MKLFYSPGACSLAVHIVLREIGQAFSLERVDLASHKTEHGDDYYRLNPKGYVPLLELDDGFYLSEGPVINQYLCDRAGRVDLMPAPGSMARYRVMEWQGFINSELHKGFGGLFNPALDEAAKRVIGEGLRRRLQWVSSQLQGRPYLAGEVFSAADAYLFTVASWAGFLGLDISHCPELQGYLVRLAARPSIQAALKAEGLTS
ncbi:glutathione transferase GstA [Pseudomonas lalucatii]|uniref:Glutathione transferase GstA n=1 Tax=Pseudomonas lalucatii TaxID=1424203 RepID=A0ABS5Q8S7_9PSED|nr:glutathione transferase GstA [Pseudomonas lalucatii]MBS7664304.1 glutathione transferase GstA [Pseudomonas lalucatii]MBS7690974.1 glutathione transferase GstA [Pseudomonas lalucatii]MBS7725542.1 glutathione transferase GstA [Pseudomonas lalucatii]